MGVVSRRWMWVKSMGVASGCNSKEVYRFPHITYPYSSCICSFLQQHPYSFLFQYFFVIKFNVLNFFPSNTHIQVPDYGRPTEAI